MDIIDEASARAELFGEIALNTARQIQIPGLPLYINDIRCCLDCEGPIPAERLKVNPDAVRCVECQEKKDRSR